MKKVLALWLFSFFAHASTGQDFVLTLQSVLQQDPEFKSVDFQTDYYDARLKRDFSRFALPSVEVSFGEFERRLETEHDKYRTGSLTAAFDVFSFGHDWSMFQSARKGQDAQEQRVWSKVMEREDVLGSLLFSYLRELRNIKILKSILELKERAFDISHDRFRRGGLSEQDLNKLRLDVSNAKGEYLVAQQELAVIEAQISSYKLEGFGLDFPWSQSLGPELVDSLLAIKTDTDELPQFRAVDLELESQDYYTNATIAQMFGKFQVTFTRGFTETRGDEAWEWRAGINYTLPLFDQFGQYTDYQQARAQWRATEVLQRLKKRSVQRVLAAQGQNLRTAFTNYTERQDALKISNKLYNDSVRQFNRGELSVNELLVDQDRLLRAEQIANQSLYQIHVALVNYCHSIGRPITRRCF